MNKRLCATIFFSCFMSVATAVTPHFEPLINQKKPKPNVVFIVDTSSSMTQPSGYHSLSKMNATKEIVSQIYTSYLGSVNIGIAKLGYRSALPRSGRPPYVGNYEILRTSVRDADNFAVINENLSAIINLKPEGDSPLNFSLYEIGKYFRGEPMLKKTSAYYPYWNYETKYKSPVQYRCQDQHIILMSNGGNIVEDGVYPKIPTDTWVREGETSLMQTGKQLSVLDLRHAKGKVGGGGQDLAGKEWLSNGSIPLSLNVHSIRFGSGTDTQDRQLELLANQSQLGSFHKANTVEELDASYRNILNEMRQIKSGTGSIEDQFVRSKDTVIYSSFYDTIAWTGEIRAYGYDQGKQDFSKVLWSTNDTIKPNQGRFITYMNGTAELNTRNLGLLDSHVNLINWLKGVDSTGFRYRGDRLGDIIDSHITYSAKDVLNINLNVVDETVREGFLRYLVSVKRREMPYNLIIAGSNDGLLNFIIGDKQANGRAGERYTTYFPRLLAPELYNIASSHSGVHHNRINGTTNVFDARIKGFYKTIGMTSMGTGGRAILGYQIYAPGEPEIRVNFELQSSDQGFENLGWTTSDIEFFNRKKGNGEEEAVAVFGNGIADNGVSSVFLVNAYTGKFIKEIVLNKFGGGASSPAIVVDQDPYTGFQRLRAIYVGNQIGELYRIDFKVDNQFQQDGLYHEEPLKLFQVAKPGAIDTKPTLVKQNDNIWIYFGTGRLTMAEFDKGPNSKFTNFFYAIRDKGQRKEIYFNQLVDRQMSTSGEDGDTIEVVGREMRADDHGWKLLLDSVRQKTYKSGERVIFPAKNYANKQIIFSSLAIQEGDEQDPCIPDKIYGGTFVVDIFTGMGTRMIKNGSGIVTHDVYGEVTGNNIMNSNPLSGGGIGFGELKATAELPQDLFGSTGSHTAKKESLPKSNCDLRLVSVNNEVLCIGGLPAISDEGEHRPGHYGRLYLHHRFSL